MTAIAPPLGEISLGNKDCPVCEREWPGDPTEPLTVTRAAVDISLLKEKVLSLSSDMWEDDKQEGNVKVTRPAHDAWGIKKIVFTFCDDVSV